MSGETNLEKLLNALSPHLLNGEYVFCTLPDSVYGDFADATPVASFSEPEGLTLVLLKEAAERHNLPYQSVFRCITLRVHSSLEAVGLTAAVSGKLSEDGIGANIIAAYFHDHVFVPSHAAKKALKLLAEFGAD